MGVGGGSLSNRAWLSLSMQDTLRGLLLHFMQLHQQVDIYAARGRFSATAQVVFISRGGNCAGEEAWTGILTFAPSSSSGERYHRVTTTGV